MTAGRRWTCGICGKPKSGRTRPKAFIGINQDSKQGVCASCFDGVKNAIKPDGRAFATFARKRLAQENPGEPVAPRRPRPVD